jgi:DNA-binding protein Fis
VQALDRTDWNQTQAGRLLGINRDQVRYRIEKFALPSAAQQRSAPALKG